MQRLRFLVWKEFLELRQNPRLFGIVIVAPIIQLTMLGYAATTDVKDVPVVVADGDRSPASRELIARFDASRELHGRRHGHDRRARSSRISSAARAWMALSIPAGLRRGDLAQGSRSTLQVVADGTRLELDDRRARLRDERSSASYAQELMAAAAAGGAAPPAIDAAHPRLVQPAAREPASS